jgi:hypothetical protein
MKRHCIYTWQVSADRHGRAEAEARTSIVCVAENRNVCHSFGRWPTSAASVSAKPTSKRRSASSSTSTRTPDGRSRPSGRGRNRPGGDEDVHTREPRGLGAKILAADDEPREKAWWAPMARGTSKICTACGARRASAERAPARTRGTHELAHGRDDERAEPVLRALTRADERIEEGHEERERHVRARRRRARRGPRERAGARRPEWA